MKQLAGHHENASNFGRRLPNSFKLLQISNGAGVCSLRGSGGSMARVARLTLAYYAATTVAAVFLGIVLVVLIQPGRGSPFSKAASGGNCETTAAQVHPAVILIPIFHVFRADLGRKIGHACSLLCAQGR